MRCTRPLPRLAGFPVRAGGPSVWSGALNGGVSAAEAQSLWDDPAFALYRQAVEALEAKDYVRASTLAGEAIKAYPDNLLAYYLRGQAALAENRWPDAATNFRKVTELHPGSFAAQRDLAMSLQQAGKTDEAVREGLEALLIVAAIVALLVKANRRDALPWVHGGWIAALLLGGLTWGVASYVITISGATREVTEGITALIAAAILLYVGFWMHGKSYARQWQDYLARRLQGALSGRTTGALAFVSFLAVYREAFETVLFYEALVIQSGPGGSVPLVGGLLAGAVVLAVLSWVIVRGSVRLPLGVFFGASSVLIGLLAVVLAGKGIAALQEAGWLSIRSVSFPSLPRSASIRICRACCSRPRSSWSSWGTSSTRTTRPRAPGSERRLLAGVFSRNFQGVLRLRYKLVHEATSRDTGREG